MDRTYIDLKKSEFKTAAEAKERIRAWLKGWGRHGAAYIDRINTAIDRAYADTDKRLANDVFNITVGVGAFAAMEPEIEELRNSTLEVRLRDAMIERGLTPPAVVPKGGPQAPVSNLITYPNAFPPVTDPAKETKGIAEVATSGMNVPRFCSDDTCRGPA